MVEIRERHCVPYIVLQADVSIEAEVVRLFEKMDDRALSIPTCMPTAVNPAG